MPIDRSKYVKHPVVSLPKPVAKVIEPQEDEIDEIDEIDDLEDVIRNPERSNELPKQQHYEPNHIRMGLEPYTPREMPPDDDNFFSVDGEVGSFPSMQGHMIDNNDFVNFDPSPLPFAKKAQQEKQTERKSIPASQDYLFENTDLVGDDTAETLAVPEVGEFLLMVFGNIVDVGSHEHIEERVKAIVYGEDREFIDLAPEPSDLVVLQRVKVKIGVFIG